ncbi:MAG: SDR family oxidoreductase [Oscillochloris sp.]|nr:SDR family oxidoreductase [Oscillochloris sp.]
MQTYLVTGGAGFIGTNLVRHLLGQGKAVRVLDNLATGYLENLAPVRKDIEFINADIRDLDAVWGAMEGVDVVLHQAALASVQRSVNNPITSNEVNVTGSLNVLWAAWKAGVQRVVVASSSSVYGDSPVHPKVETLRQRPISPYAVSKLATEAYCQSFNLVYGMPTIALRYFNVFGPYQDPTSDYAAVIPKFAALMMRGAAPTIYGDGRQSRDFTYIDNVVQANMLAAEAPAGISGIFNVACGASYSLIDLVDRLNRLLGTSLRPLHTAAAVGDVRESLADISRAHDLLGYAPHVAFDQGLRSTLEYLGAMLPMAAPLYAHAVGVR